MARIAVIHLGWMIFAQPAHAVDDPTAGVTVFPVTYFADAQPRTAFDMVVRLPGFTFNGGNDDVRGYTGSSANVLVDSRRPASKYSDVEEILKRISASSVARIELIRGAAPGIDMQGQILVANIVRLTDAAIDARADLGLFIHGDGRLLPEGGLEGSSRNAERLLEGSIRAYENADDDSGTGFRLRRNTQGELTRFAESRLVAENRGVRATAGYERPLFRGKLRLSVALSNETKDEEETITASVPENTVASITELKDSRQAEVGAHYNGTIGDDSKLDILVIQQSINSDETEREYSAGDTAVVIEDYRSGESILRVAVTNTLSTATSFEWGAEGAFNFLDSTSASEENGVPVIRPAENVRIEERRVEAFVRFNSMVGANLNLEYGAALEHSKITQVGDSNSSKTLTYAKPRAMLTWTVSSSDQIHMQVRREIGQLDFEDFVTSSELSTGTVNAGNPDLIPYSAWDFAVIWERKLRDDATVTIGYLHSRISDVVDIVPIFADTDGDGVAEVYEGPGNIGDGRRGEAELAVTWPMDRLGVQGGLLTAKVLHRTSATVDPLTGESREIIDTKRPWEGRVEFTQDLPLKRIRWGMHIRLSESESQYRLDETRTEVEQLWLGLFAEYFPTPAWSVFLEAQNLSGRADTLSRNLYSAPRDAGEIYATDVRSRSFDPYIHLRLSWKFL